MQIFITSVVLGLASIAAAVNPVAGFDPKSAAPQGCPSPTPWYNCIVTQAAVRCGAKDTQCGCSSVSAYLDCYHDYCPNVSFGVGSYTYYCNHGPATHAPVGPAASQGSGDTEATATPKGPASSHATATTSPKSQGKSSSEKATAGSAVASSSPRAQETGGVTSAATGGATAANSSPSASASGKPNAGGRSMTISGGLWTVAATVFGAIVYRL